MSRVFLSPEERFWSRVEKTDGCWLWQGNVSAGRSTCLYGGIRIDGRREYVHRVSYRWAKGEIPIGFEIDHLCKNTACVNPDHLEAVTPRENKLRGNGMYARRKRMGKQPNCSHCGSPRQVYGGQFQCVPCFKEKRRQCDRARYWRNKGVDDPANVA